MLRYLTKKRKQARKEKNHDAVKEVYRRGASTVPSENLAVHQQADPARVEKVKAAAEARRQQRNARQLAAKEKEDAGRNRHAQRARRSANAV